MAGLFCVGFLGRPLTVKGRFLARLFCSRFWVGETTFKTHIRPLPVSSVLDAAAVVTLSCSWFGFQQHTQARHRFGVGLFFARKEGT